MTSPSSCNNSAPVCLLLKCLIAFQWGDWQRLSLKSCKSSGPAIARISRGLRIACFWTQICWHDRPPQINGIKVIVCYQRTACPGTSFKPSLNSALDSASASIAGFEGQVVRQTVLQACCGCKTKSFLHRSDQSRHR